jgi:two-component system nitrate/nitrite response regulator NarL
VPHCINLYVVDDHSLFREGLVRLLQHDANLRVLGGSGTVEEALADLAHLQVDVLIVDYDLGGDTALTLVRALRGTSFPGRVLLVTAGLPDQQARALIQLGIHGIVHKYQPPAELYTSILHVAEGKVLLDHEYLRRLMTDASPAKKPAIRLTERDRQVLGAVLEGLSNKEIAQLLGVSESAVKSSLQQLFAKTGVRTRSQLVRVALEDLQGEL